MSTQGKTIDRYLDEIKNLRAEIDWRLRIVYTAPVYYVSALFVATSLATNTNVSSGSRDVLVLVGSIFALGNAMYIGVLSANHYIEKKIELYILDLQKRVRRTTNEPHFAWISYQHGYQPSQATARGTLALFRVVHFGVGLFQYLVPVIVGVGVLAWLAVNHAPSGASGFVFWVAAAFTIVACIGLVGLLVFTNYVYREHVRDYSSLEEAIETYRGHSEKPANV